MVNIGGLTGKARAIENFMDDHQISLMFIGETWCSPGGTARMYDRVSHV